MKMLLGTWPGAGSANQKVPKFTASLESMKVCSTERVGCQRSSGSSGARRRAARTIWLMLTGRVFCSMEMAMLAPAPESMPPRTSGSMARNKGPLRPPWLWPMNMMASGLNTTGKPWRVSSAGMSMVLAKRSSET